MNDRGAGKGKMARAHDELEWVPVEVLWDERAPEEQERLWERPGVLPTYQAQPEQHARRLRAFQDDAREPAEKFGPRRRRDGEKPRRKKFRLDEIDADDY